MTRLVVALRFLIVSPEFAVLLGGAVFFSLFPDFFNNSSANAALADDVLKYVAVIPLASTAWLINSGRELLFPARDTSNVLHQWPDYWKLKYGFNVALFYSLVFSVTAVVAWATWKTQPAHSQIGMAVALLGAGSNFLTCYYAQMSRDEILAKLIQPRQ